MKYNPWINDSFNAWGGKNKQNNEIIEYYNKFKNSKRGKELIPEYVKNPIDLDSIEVDPNEFSDLDNENEEKKEEELEEWQYMSRIDRKHLEEDILDNSQAVDWSEDAREFNEIQIKEMSTWINDKKKLNNPNWTKTLDKVNINKFNNGQKKAYNIIIN